MTQGVRSWINRAPHAGKTGIRKVRGREVVS